MKPRVALSLELDLQWVAIVLSLAPARRGFHLFPMASLACQAHSTIATVALDSLLPPWCMRDVHAVLLHEVLELLPDFGCPVLPVVAAPFVGH